MYSDDKIILQIVSLLKAYNIKRIVISAGSRHFPLIHSLEADKFFKLYSVVDERSAAFFALGLIQNTLEPVAVCCTSGSAVINYGSAVSEAFYQHLPLLLITADRLPKLLNQFEDQMIDQVNIFRGFIKTCVNLTVINDESDEWYVNRLINEALIELEHHGRGPVQINYPISAHNVDKYQTEKLPDCRKISLHTFEIDELDWQFFAEKLSNKKVMIIWGQSVIISEKLEKGLNEFCKRFNCVILSDNISNLRHSKVIRNTYVVLNAISSSEKAELMPDVVVSIGANIVFNDSIKNYLKQSLNSFEHWIVGPIGKVCDPYRSLSDIFEMHEHVFFNKITNCAANFNSDNKYFDKWKEVSEDIEEPNVPYSQLYAIGKLLKRLPSQSILHLGNSNTIRMGQLFEIDSSILCYCNRGVNGIDGCMSTAIGYSAESDKLNFLVLGDLTFFYDMNSLWIKHLSNNLRILLINNGGGAVIHIPFDREMGKSLPPFASAGHNMSVEGWIKSLGFRYFSANNQEEFDEKIELLVTDKSEVPICLEVFTQLEEDIIILKDYFSRINRTTLIDRVKQKAKSVTTKYMKNI